MVDRFVQFSTSISEIYKHLQRLERTGMERFGLKGSHTQCLVMVHRHPEGVTAAQLGTLCGKNKAAISRTLAELEALGLIQRMFRRDNAYQAKILLTPKGCDTAEKVDTTIFSAVEKAGEGLSDEARTLFYDTLRIISENMKNIRLSE